MSDLYEVLQLSPRSLAESIENLPGVNLNKAKDIFSLFDKVRCYTYTKFLLACLLAFDTSHC